MSLHKKHRISFEDIDQVVEPEQIHCSSALIDMAQSQAQASYIDSQINSVVIDSDSLNRIADVIEANIQTGLSPEAADAVSVVTESIYNKYRLNVKSTPGCESFTETSKVMFTAIALENTKEAIAKIWKLIVNAIKAAYNSVVDFLKKIFRSATGIKQKAQKLIEEVKSFSFDKKVNNEILNSENVATEDIEEASKKKLSATSITMIFADKTDAPSVFRTTESLKKQLVAMPILFESVHKSVEITQTLLKEFGDKKLVDNFSYPTFTHGLQKSPEADGKYRSEMFPGGMALNVVGAAEGTNFKGLEAIHAMSNTKIYVGPWDTKQQKVYHKAIPVLNKSSIEKLLEDSIIIATTVEKLETQADKLQKGFKSLTNDVSQFSAFSENPTQEMSKTLNDLKGIVTTTKSICATGLPSVLSYSLRVSNALVDYCYVSVASYSKVKV